MPGTRGDRARPNPGSRPGRAESSGPDEAQGPAAAGPEGPEPEPAGAEGPAGTGPERPGAEDNPAEGVAGAEEAGPDEGAVAEGAGSDEVAAGADEVAAEGEIVDATPDGPPSSGPAGAEVVDEVEEVAEKVEVSLEDVLAAATSERDEFRDHLLRLQADFDNYRKRVQKELGEAGDKALGHFVDGLLPVLDAVDGARAHGVGEIEQIAGLLVDLLAKQGLERVGADGDVFDPTLHDAVLHEAGDDDVQTVAEVLRAGWRWRGRVLRPAMVKVIGG